MSREAGNEQTIRCAFKSKPVTSKKLSYGRELVCHVAYTGWSNRKRYVIYELCE